MASLNQNYLIFFWREFVFSAQTRFSMKTGVAISQMYGLVLSG
jgi:hypothetical protein